MKNLLLPFTFCLLTSSLVLAQPYADNNDALFYRSTGKGISYNELPEKSKIWSKGMDFTCWNGDMSCNNKYAIGSQNHPVMAAMGWGDYKWMAALCRYEKQTGGIFGRELGSPAYYFANVVAAKIVALRDARAAGAYNDAKDIAESLRCVWAYDALVASVTPRKNCWINLAGNVYTNAGDAANYNGLTVAAAGDRWHTETNITSDSHGIFLTWALDWQPRSTNPNKNLLTSNGKWWMENTAHCTGVPYYNLTTEPEAFGLTATERQKLQDVVNGDVNAAKWAAQVVANFGTWKDPGVLQLVQNCYHKIRMRKTTLGTEIIYFNPTNGNKPCQAATQIFNNGDYKSIRPNFYHGTGANNGYTCWVANGLIQADAPGDGAYVSMPEMGGTILWEVNIDGHDIVFNGTPVTPAGPATYATGPDVSINAITAPAANITSATVTPKVTIQNNGSTTLNTVYISYTLNNGPMWTTSWKGTLAPNATANVTLWTAPVSSGNYTLKVFTGGPNFREDANTANDDQSINFSVGSTPTQTNDAGINIIVAPLVSVTDDSIQPVGKIKNFGQATLTSASIRYKLNNGTPVTANWAGNLASGASVNYTFPKIPITAGTHTIQIYTVNPNNQTDANTSNDAQTLVFTVTSPFVTDVEGVSVGEPFSLGCATTIEPIMVIQNIGPVTLDQVTINYSVDNGPVVSRSYSVATGTGLPVGDAMGLRGNSSAISSGTHSLKMWLSLPNAVNDADNTNDTVTSVFTVGVNGLALPFTEDFESTTVGQVPATWTRYNWDAFDEWFVYGMPGNKAMAFNNHVYAGAQNTRDDLTLPTLYLSGNSSAWLTFDLAHASKPNSTVFDSLEVSISIDCGNTFTHLWGQGGAALNTAPATAVVFIPAGSQDYKNIQINLSAYNSFNNAILRFTNWSNNNNSTLIDNVNIVTTTTGVDMLEEVSYLNVYPNPASDLLQLSFDAVATGNYTIRIVNALGQAMIQSSIASKAGYNQAQLDVSNLPNGIYNLLLDSETTHVKTKKVVIAR